MSNKFEKDSIEELKDMSIGNWIDINDRLPDEVAKTGLMVLVNKIPPDDKTWIYGNIDTAVFFKGNFHKDFNKGYILKVSHWQYLPESPLK